MHHWGWALLALGILYYFPRLAKVLIMTVCVGLVIVAVYVVWQAGFPPGHGHLPPATAGLTPEQITEFDRLLAPRAPAPEPGATGVAPAEEAAVTMRRFRERAVR